jgi:hypothetical protein
MPVKQTVAGGGRNRRGRRTAGLSGWKGRRRLALGRGRRGGRVSSGDPGTSSVVGKALIPAWNCPYCKGLKTSRRAAGRFGEVKNPAACGGRDNNLG